MIVMDKLADLELGRKKDVISDSLVYEELL